MHSGRVLISLLTELYSELV